MAKVTQVKVKNPKIRTNIITKNKPKPIVRQVQPRFRVSPVALPPDKVAVTQEFGAGVDYSNLNPNRIQRHEGIDFAPTGDAYNTPNIPVVATENATVISVERQNGGYGNYVTIRFDDGTLGALYAHLDNVFVRPGQHLREGEQIGTMGSSGRSTGRHLHFNLIDFNAPRGNWIYPQVIDPTEYIRGGNTIETVREKPISVSNPRNTNPKPRPLPVRPKPPVLPRIEVPEINQDEPTVSDQINDALVQGLPPVFQPSTGDTVSIGAYNPVSVIAGGINPDTGEFDVLQLLTGKTGDEREEYIQEKTPLILLAIVGISFVVIGVARLVFNPNPVPLKS